MGFGNFLSSPGRWLVVVLGVVGLIAARSWLRKTFQEVITKATTPDKNPIWDDTVDWSESTIEFDTPPLAHIILPEDGQ